MGCLVEKNMKFVAFKRNTQGTGASRRLRHTGRTPGVLYGGKTEPMNIELDHNDLWHALKKEAFHASILDMELEGQTSQVLLKDAQFHPFRQQVLHVDFLRVDANTRLQMKVPLHYAGEENSPAVKLDQCLINHIATELQISCLPKDLPEFIAIDLSHLKKGHSLHLSGITLPPGVKALTHGQKDPVLVAVVATKEEPAASAAGEANK